MWSSSKGDTANSGEIVVALVMGEEATLKRLRKKGGSIALEAGQPEPTRPASSAPTRSRYRASWWA